MDPLPTNSQWERFWELVDRLKRASRTQREAALQDEDPIVRELVRLHFRLPPEVGEPGSLIGPYELLEWLGDGGMGVVYKVQDCSGPHHVVALKVIHEHLVSHDYIDHFVTEVKYLGRMVHPHIVQVIASGHQDGRPYFTMICCRGGDLDRVIKKHGPLESTTAALYVSRIAEAVQYLHEQGVVDRGVPTLHGDLKPKNILIGETYDDKLPHGWPYLADFGLVGVLRDTAPGFARGFQVGTLHYMSPEQAEGRQDIGPASDVWGLGVILFECLTGSVPFTGETEADVLYRIIYDETPSPRKRRQGIPPDLQRICLKCLKKRVEDRYRSASELITDLGCFLREEPLIFARPETLWERVVQWTRREPALAARLAVIVACSVILWGYRLVMGEFAPLEKDHWIWGLEVTKRLRAVGQVEPIIVSINQVILVAWGLASWAFQRQLTRKGQEGGLQFGWRVVDVLALSLLIQMDDALMSPLTVAFAVLIVASAFWARADQVLQTTLLSMGGYLALVFACRLGHSGVPLAYRHFHYLVGLALLGLMLMHQANRTRALARM
jgi:serine/threonine-protein kinase